MPNERIYIEDTIVASASGDGSAGVNVIRVSGPDTEDIASVLLQSLPEPRIASYTKFQNKNKETIDVGIALYFPGPNSYTGESILELHAHGGSIIGNSIIEEIMHKIFTTDLDFIKNPKKKANKEDRLKT